MAELDYEGFWKDALIQLRNELGEAEFSGWFSETKYLRTQSTNDGGCIFVGIPSAFHRDKVKTRYQNTILAKLKELSGVNISINYEIIRKNENTGKKASIDNQSNQKNTDFGGFETKKMTSDTSETQKIKKKKDKLASLNIDFTFDRYIKGENNAFAVNAAHAISKNPGKVYNPVLIYGGVGLGKTHLMHAIGNHIHENTDYKVICVTSEDFLNEYMEGIQQGKMSAFKNKFRYTDVLLIDDIQFLTDKPGVQEELFHTFNALAGAKKQLVFTCDRQPSELKKFSERLITRFEQGIKTDLQPPRYEERCAILKATAESKNADIPNEVIDYISKNISSNIRDLIGALNTLIAYSELMQKPVTIEIAQQSLKNVFYASKHSNLSNDVIIRVVAEYFGLTPNDLKGKKRTGNVVFARQLAMYIARELTEYSTTEVGQDFGGKDHTTVMHSIEKIKGKLLTDTTLESTIENIKRQIKEFSAKY